MKAVFPVFNRVGFGPRTLDLTAPASRLVAGVFGPPRPWSGGGPPPTPKRTVEISGSSVQVKTLSTWLQANSDWDGVTVEELTINISGGSVWSNSKATPAFIADAGFPAETTIRVNVAAGVYLCGKGDWSPAGTGFKAERPVTVDNLGTIEGGGRHASGSGGVYCGNGSYYTEGEWRCDGWCTSSSGTAGYGANRDYANQSQTNGTTGAACGTSGGCSGCPGGAPGYGGAAGTDGKAVEGDAFITWISTGTRNGAIT